MKAFYFTSLFLLFILSSYAHTAPKLSQIIVQDNQFITTDGKTTIFCGLNMSDPDKLEKSGH